MAESLFSSYIILAGTVLIIFNTGLLLAELLLQFFLLFLHILSALLQLTFRSLTTYPLTLLILILLAYKNRNRPPNILKGKILYKAVVSFFAVGAECAICLEQGVDKVLFTCGHFYHAHCIDPWIINHQQCPLCREYFSKGWLKQSQGLSFKLMQCLLRVNRAKMLMLAVTIFTIYFSYSYWLLSWGWRSSVSSQLKPEMGEQVTLQPSKILQEDI